MSDDPVYIRAEITKAIIKCVNFTAEKHRDQRRKDHSATPYVNHPIAVAHILTDEAGETDPTVIQAALLHDTVEDTDCTFEEIEAHFGKEVSDVVREVTDDKSLTRDERKQVEIEFFAKSSRKAKLVKLADKLHNCRDLETNPPRGWSPERIAAYFSFARKVTEGLTGVNMKLDRLIDEVLKRNDV